MRASGALAIFFLALLVAVVAAGAYLSRQEPDLRMSVEPSDCPIRIVLQPAAPGRWNVTLVEGTWRLDELRYEFVGEDAPPAGTLARPAEGVSWVDAAGPGTVDVGDALVAERPGSWNVWLRTQDGAEVGGTYLCL